MIAHHARTRDSASRLTALEIVHVDEEKRLVQCQPARRDGEELQQLGPCFPSERPSDAKAEVEPGAQASAAVKCWPWVPKEPWVCSSWHDSEGVPSLRGAILIALGLSAFLVLARLHGQPLPGLLAAVAVRRE